MRTQETEIIELTFGDLVELVTRVAAEDACSEYESYELASRALEKILVGLMYQV